MKTNKLIFGLLTLLLLASCSQDDDGVILNTDTDSTPDIAFDNGFFVLGEGNWGSGNANMTFVSETFDNVQIGAFYNVNSSSLGDTAQSVNFYNDNAYIIVNVSNTIAIANRYSLEVSNTITTGLNNPRYIAFYNGKGYVTNWGDPFDNTDDYIAVINLTTYAVESTISVGEGPEQIVVYNGKLYVSMKGGYSQNNVVSVVDLSDNSINDVTVGYLPDEMVLDSSNNLVVICRGIPSWTGSETNGTIEMIDTTTDTVSQTLNFATTEHPDSLVKDGNYLYYYLDGNVFSMLDIATSLPTSASVTGLDFYGMNVKDGLLFGTNANFTALSSLKIYSLTSGNLTEDLQVGIGASRIYFN